MHPLIVAGAAGMAGIMAIKALFSRSSYNERLAFAKALGLQKPEQYTDLEALNAAIEVQLKQNALINEFKELKKKIEDLFRVNQNQDRNQATEVLSQVLHKYHQCQLQSLTNLVQHLFHLVQAARQYLSLILDQE